MSGTDVDAARYYDREVLVRRSMSKGYQYFSLAAPVLYTVFTFSRRTPKSTWTLNKMLRATWITGAIGIAEGGLFEYLRTMQESAETLRQRRLNAVYNTSSLREDDHSTIGAIIGAVLTPAIFWKRASRVHLFLGGAGLGTGLGVIAHWGRVVTEGPPPRVNVPPIMPAPTSSSPATPAPPAR